jgi:ribosomal protein S18 acetylase RimI-like enzyme
MFCLKMMKMEIRQFDPCDEESAVQLWADCGLVVPWNNPRRDIQRKLKIQPEMFLVAYSGGRINYLAVHPKHRRSGIGRRMMDEAESRLRAAGCPKINLQVRSKNAEAVEFYKRIGFKTDDVVSLGKRLEPDN